MYERESSVASSVDFYEPEGTLNAPIAQMQTDAPVAKRKAEDASSAVDKKRRLDAHVSPSLSTSLGLCAGLPPAVWQHIFSFCSLADLGRLIQVNRPFRSYLSDVSNVSLSKPEHGCLHLLKSEALWASARNAFNSNAPKPLPGLTELHMWQLVWSKRCQFCNKLDSSVSLPGSAEKLWQQGPGEAGVRTIWPFAIRACGPCLMQQCQTDASLLFSAASALRPALPFAPITTDHHYLPAYALQSATIPANVEIGKYYYRKHVQDIVQELNGALALGPSAAEEWSKGLEARGRQRMKAAETWERWCVKYKDTKRAASAARSPAAASRKLSKSPKRQPLSPVIHAPVPATPSTHYVHQRPPTIPPNVFTPQPMLTGSAQPNQQRNLHDANEAKANRKTDIERRCQQMNPPIAPNILRHMDAFKAAIQISQPMTDYAWSVLQPRLIANLPAAQQAEADHVSRVALLPTKTTDRRHQDANSKEAKEAMDREWEDSQRPIRDRLSSIADDFIHRDWDHGKALTYENSPKFAADLLIYVRRTYYETINGPTAALQASQKREPPDHKPHLVLENMKWVYDNKLKPLTEQYRRELFLCHGNDCESNTRLYGFEGVVQHYGAKHTTTFSSGNIVVAWREAEWPEETPFHPDPISVKYAPQASSNAAAYGGFMGGFSRAGTSTPHMPTHMPQASPGPYQYSGYNGPFAPPQVSYDYSQVYGVPAEGHAYQSMGPPGYGPHPGHPSYMPSPAMINSAVAPPPAVPAPNYGIADPVSNGSEDPSHSTASFDKETSGIKDLPNSLRIYVLLHRVVSKFHVAFNYEPNLNHFIGALSNHEISKALKNAPGLCCKACQLQSAQHLTGAYYSKPEERRTYTVLTLFSHFRSQHLVAVPSGIGYGQASTTLDWKEDMIELPSERFISGLIHAPGMDDEKLLMIATTFPSLFPLPLPTIGKIEDDGLTSPASSGPAKDALRASGTPGIALDKSGPSTIGASRTESPRLSKPAEDEYGPERPATATDRANQAPSLGDRKRSHRDSPPLERGERYYGEPRYYSKDQPEDGYPRSREFLEYVPTPRVFHAGPAYDEYSGRRTGFRETERFYGPPAEEIVYASHGRQYNSHVRQVRYAEEDGQRHGHHYPTEARPREASGPRGQSAADRFLEEFVPEQPPASEGEPPPPRPDSKPSVSAHEDDDSRYTPPPPNPPPPSEPESQYRPLTVPQPAPSIVSNGSGYQVPPNGRHNPTPDSVGAPRQPMPQRRRDRPHEHRTPSRYYRYMSIPARDDPYGRAPSITRSQRSRYEEQRRRIDEAETPQPTTERDRAHGPTYSRDHSVGHASPEESFYPPVRPPPRGYVSVQDRAHHISPPRYHRYDEPRGPPPPIYYDEYGQPEYEIVRFRGDYHQPRPYMADYRQPGPARYEPYHEPYVYERPPPQRYNSRPDDYVYYEDRQRERPLPGRPAHEPEAEPLEPPPVGIKVEVATPAPMPEGL
ncbi:hypothetical protein ST47_g2546 [Ascochyta rabiei]|uniref:Uncharacterized protein n=1 Tax=Didymella rabiei TaxID=5454 RepID=A0A163JFH9_DIDRA|nr:hypothetical protein ST47_g2546 [Ascochyta rabiei]